MKNDKEVKNELDIKESENSISFEECIELGKKQWEGAMKGDVRMLIWLGKKYLNQSESPMVLKEDKEELPQGFDLEEIPTRCDNIACTCKDCNQNIFPNDDDLFKS